MYHLVSKKDLRPHDDIEHHKELANLDDTSNDRYLSLTAPSPQVALPLGRSLLPSGSYLLSLGAAITVSLRSLPAPGPSSAFKASAPPQPRSTSKRPEDEEALGSWMDVRVGGWEWGLGQMPAWQHGEVAFPAQASGGKVGGVRTMEPCFS